MTYKIIDFPHFEETKGTLTPFELDEGFPFEVKRVYSVTAPEKTVRGAHAHLEEAEVFVAISGKITAKVDDGDGEKVIALDHPSKALYVPTLCWHEFCDFSADAVLLCFSSTHYLPGTQNYITDKDEFYAHLRSTSDQE